MSIASEITRLQNAKADLKTAIQGKGVAVSVNAKLDQYADLVDAIQQGSTMVLQAKSETYNASNVQQTDTIAPDTGYDGLSQVDITINAVQSGSATTPATSITANPSITVNTTTGVISATVSTSQNVTPTVVEGYVESGTSGTITVSGSNTSALSTQSGKTVTPTESEQTAVAANKYTLGAVKVGAISSTYVGSGITQRTSSDLQESGAIITAPSGYYANNATLTVPSGSAVPAATITATSASVTAGLNLLTFTKTVNNTPQVSEGYISAGTAGDTAISLSAPVTTRTSSDLTASGATVTAPAGYYGSAASKTVQSGTAGTPSATKGAVSNHSITVTPSVTNTTGYITGGTKTGTAVTVSASELVSGTLTLSSVGTADVTNYAVVSIEITDGNNIGYGITDGTIPRVGIAKVGYAELGE